MSREKIITEFYTAFAKNPAKIDSLVTSNRLMKNLLSIPEECVKLLRYVRIENNDKITFNALLKYIQLEKYFAHNTLLYACKKNDFLIIESLLGENKKADINYNINGETPLSCACENGQLKIINYLLDNGAAADLELVVDGKTINPALNAAIKNGRIDIFEALIAKGAQPKLIENDNHETCWEMAAAHGQVKMLDYLLNTYPLANYATLITPISKVNNPNIIEELIQRLHTQGVDVKNQDKFKLNGYQGFTSCLELVTDAIAESDNIALFNSLFDHNDDDVAILNQSGLLVKACIEGWIDLIDRLLKFGLDPNHQFQHHGNALHAACAANKIDVLGLLLSGNNKCELNAVNDNGDTPLTYLILNFSSSAADMAKLLVIQGADINKPNRRGDSPLFLAIKLNYSTELINFILSLNPNVNTVDCFGLTPLMHAIEKGNAPIVKLLLDNADIDHNITSPEGRTAAEMAEFASDEIRELFADIPQHGSRP